MRSARSAKRNGAPSRRHWRRPVADPTRSPEVATDNRSSIPPFIGSRVAKGIALDDISSFLNLTALFRNQWGYRPEARVKTTRPSRSG